MNFLKDDIVGESKSAKTLVKVHGKRIVRFKSFSKRSEKFALNQSTIGSENAHIITPGPGI